MEASRMLAKQFIPVLTMLRRCPGRIAGVAVLCAGLGGCNVAMKPVRAAGLAAKDLTLQVDIGADANGNSVVPVDLVVVDDKKVLAKVQDMTAGQWFAKKSDMILMNAKTMRVVSYEFVPGSLIPAQHLTAAVSKLGVVMFAQYSSKGDHRAVLPQVGQVTVSFGFDDFTVSGPTEAASAEADKTPAKKPPKYPKVPSVPKM